MCSITCSPSPTEETLVYGSGRGQLRRLTFLLDYTPAWLSPLPLYQCLNAGRPGVLYESVDIAPIYGRYSLAVIDPPVIVEGKDERFRIRALNRRGQDILAQTLSAADIPVLSSRSSAARRPSLGSVPCERQPVAEDERLHLNNISQVIRNLLHAFRCDDRFLGLYGAFAYDFVRLFEPLPDRLPAIPTQDFRLFMPDMLLSYDHMRERAVLYLYDFLNSTASAHELLRERLEALPTTEPLPPGQSVGCAFPTNCSPIPGARRSWPQWTTRGNKCVWENFRGRTLRIVLRALRSAARSSCTGVSARSILTVPVLRRLWR